MKILKSAFLLYLALIILNSCTTSNISTRSQIIKDAKIIKESEVLRIPLIGEAADRKSEISGLCWYGDNLILLPQYPNSFEGDLGKIFFIQKEKLENFISGKDNSPILPDQYSINLNSLEHLFTLGSGFESITTNNDTAYFTIESMKDGKTETILISGIIDQKEKSIKLNKDSIIKDPTDIFIHNISDESILFHKNRIIPVYEVFGENKNNNPKVSIFDTELKFLKKIDFPSIEYRITDLSSVDENGNFWAINYLYPGDIRKLNPTDDKLISKFGLGISHKSEKPIERLVQFNIANDMISLVNKAPIYIELMKGESRNWEGLAKYKTDGFLMATDTFPETILAFIKVENL